jgi:PAS domain S-box-containing protein
MERREGLEPTHDSEQAFRKLAENSPDIIARFDRALRHLYVNPGAERVTGLTAERYLGRTNEELGMPAESVAAWNEALHEVFASGRERSLEFAFASPGGARHVYESCLVPEFDGHGQVTTVLSIARDVTERVTLEQALQQTAVELRERNKELKCLYAVSSLAQLADVPLARLITACLDELVRAYQEPAATCARALVGGNEFRSDGFRMSGWRQSAPLYYDGTDTGVIEVHFTGDPPAAGASPFLPEEQKLLDSVAAIVSKAIRRQRDRAALAASEARYRNLFENMTDGYALHEIILDGDGVPCDYRYLEVNSAFERILGLKREAVVGRTALELMPETEPFWIARFGQVALTGEGIHFERYSRTFGRYFDVAVTSPERGLFAAIFADVTERRALQETLRRREAEFRALVEHSPDLVSRYDRGMRRIYANPAVCRTLGRSLADLLGKTNRDLGLPDELAHRVEENLGAVLSSGEGRVVTMDLPTAAGVRALESHLVPETGSDGAVETVLVITRDMTERVQAEQALHRLNERLTASEVALRRSNRDLEQFASVVSHDLRAPLRAVSTLASGIEEDEGERLSAAAREQLELLRARVRRMDEMILGLLEFARCGGRLRGDGPVAVRELVEEVVATIDLPAGFSVDIAPDLPTLTTDRVHLRQVLANLIENAVKHHDRPDGHVWVKAADAGGHYLFSVIDDGPGIAPEYHQAVFRMLQRVPGRRVDGTGIGLAVVRKVVERAGGTVELESAPGQGATFRFTWPKSLPPDVSDPVSGP